MQPARYSLPCTNADVMSRFSAYRIKSSLLNTMLDKTTLNKGTGSMIEYN